MKRKHWMDDLFTMTCVTCGKQFTKYYEAVAHIDTHPKPDKKKDDEPERRV